MENFHQLLRLTSLTGTDQFNKRTGKTCRIRVGEQLKYDLRLGFPAITTKKFAFKSMVAELLGFFRGYDNAADFRALGTTIWDKNANETQGWLDNPYRNGTDDLGRIYGKQWTDWKDRRVINLHSTGSLVELDRLTDMGFDILAQDNVRGVMVMERSINQLENALATLLTDPSDRRIIIGGWNPAELDQMALPPCHVDYRFVALENPRVLHLVMTIRSWDLFLGAPFNIAETALFLSVMARLADFEPGTITIQAANAHLYDNHFEQVREQLDRDHLKSPSLFLSSRIKPVSLSEVKGAFERIEPTDIALREYESHAPIKADMAA